MATDGNATTGPYYTLQAAHDAVPSSGRILVFGQSYGTFPETATLGATTKSMSVQLVDDSSSAVFGQ